MDWITSSAAVGNIEDAMNVRSLRESGITAVVCLNGFPNLSWTSMIWRPMAIRDGPGNDPLQLRKAASAVHELIEAGNRVLVQCAEGKSRSPIILALYLTLYKNLEFGTAMLALQSIRRAMQPDDELLKTALRLAPETRMAGAGVRRSIRESPAIVRRRGDG